MLKLGDKVFVRDGWIEADWMVPAGEIVAIGYEKNSDEVMVVLLNFENFKSVWFHRIAVKEQ